MGSLVITLLGHTLICGSHHSRRATRTKTSFSAFDPKPQRPNLLVPPPESLPRSHTSPFPETEGSRTLSGPECMVQGQEAGEPVSKRTTSKARQGTQGISPPISVPRLTAERASLSTKYALATLCLLKRARAHSFLFSPCPCHAGIGDRSAVLSQGSR